MPRFARPIALLLALTAGPVLAADKMPEAVVGNWIATTVSATQYWHDDGTFAGNGSGSAQYYEFHDDGTYKYYMHLEVRTGSFVSKADTWCEGKVHFGAHKFTLLPKSGHYHSETGGHVNDRPMNDEDLGRMAKTYNWKTGRSADGKPTLIVPFDDGSRFEFKPSETQPVRK